MFKPSQSKWKVFLAFLTLLCVVLFPATASSAVDSTPSPSPSVSPTIEPAVSPSPSVSPSPTVSPSPSPSPTRDARFIGDFNHASSLQVVVNKQRRLSPVTYNPATIRYFTGTPISIDAYQPLKRMAAAMKAEGAGTLVLNSGYRSYATQVAIHNQKVAQLGQTAGERLAARPGHSEHQTGLAADVSATGQGCVIQVCFSSTKGGKWLAKNAHRFGFILRYQNGYTFYTGYQFEPWHFRYVGTDVATDMFNRRFKVLERYRGLPAAPNY